MKVQSQKSAQREVVVLNLDVRLVNAAVCCLKDRHCVLSYCIGGIGGDTKNSDSALCGSLGVNVVESGAAKQNELNAALGQDLNDFTGRFVIDENADRVVTLSQVCRLNGQTAVEILDVNIVSALSLVSGEFAEENAVIVLGAEERDSEDSILLGLGSDLLEHFLDLRDRLFLIGTVSSNVQDRTLGRVKSEDLKNVIAGGNISIALDHDCTLEIGACLGKKCRGTRMNTE